MIQQSVDSGANNPRWVSWEDDYATRANPELVTSLLREQVPVLDYVQWRVTRVEPGLAESVLPLNTEATNQHFTHQASLFVLAADYTGGIAVASLLRGWPVVGIHPVPEPQSVSLWLLKVEIKYLRPSVGDLTVCAKVDLDKHARIQRRFFEGRPVIETIDIQCYNDGVLVGEAMLTYFARQSDALRTASANPDKINILYELKLTSSAELIAGVRAQETGKLFHDPFAAQMAGKHGMALAKRFCIKSPQLGGMVASRTRHLDLAMQDFIAKGGRDVVLLGAGWDMRPFRLPFPEGTRIFELDLPSTLAERLRRLEQLGITDPPGVTRIPISMDVRTTTLADLIGLQIGPKTPLFVAWEGMSMYFQEEDVCAILRGMEPLMTHGDSRIWFDLADRQAVEAPETMGESVQAFMRGMQMLGEPFTFGTDRLEELLAKEDLICLENVPSNVLLDDKEDEVYAAYRFCLAGGQKCVAAVSQEPEKTIRADMSSPQPPTPHLVPETAPSLLDDE